MDVIYNLDIALATLVGRVTGRYESILSQKPAWAGFFTPKVIKGETSLDPILRMAEK